MERTFVMIKPDATQRNLIGKIIHEFELNGLTVVDVRMSRLTKEEAGFLYEEHAEKAHFPDLVAYTCSGPVVLLSIAGTDAVARARALIGHVDPSRVEEGTLRAKFALCQRKNAVHGSDSVESAHRELGRFFRHSVFD